MINDFLMSGLYQWASNGHVKLLERFQIHLQEVPKAYFPYGAMNVPFCNAELDAIENFRSSHDGKKRILFVRPKANSIPAMVSNDFNIFHLEDRDLQIPEVVEDRLRLPSLKWYWLIAKAVSSEQIQSHSWTQLLLFEVKHLLEAIQPDLICFSMDLLPIERAISLVAQTLRIPTATLQDGTFSKNIDRDLLFGDASNYFITWSDYFKRIIENGGKVPSQNVFVAGYPYAVSHFQAPNLMVQKIVFLGQNFESFSSDLELAKWEVVGNVRQACEDVGIEFRYRPHPGEILEDLASHLPAESILEASEPLTKTFEKDSAFFSISSTALVEAAISNRIAVQVFDPQFLLEDLQESGVCYSCQTSVDSISFLLQQLKEGRISPKAVSSDYLLVHEDRTANYCGIYNDIIEHFHSDSRPNLEGMVTCSVNRDEQPIELRESVPISNEPVISAFRIFEGGTIPSSLSLDQVNRSRRQWDQAGKSHGTISDSIADFSQTYIARRMKVLTRTIHISRPRDFSPYGTLLWLVKMRQAFSPDGIPIQIQIDPERILFKAEDRDQRFFEAVYQALRTMLDGNSPEILPAKQKEIHDFFDNWIQISEDRLRQSLIDDAYQLRCDELELRRTFDEVEERVQAAIDEVEERVQAAIAPYASEIRRIASTLELYESAGPRSYQALLVSAEEFERVKQTKFWKLREGLAKLVKSR